MRSTDVNLVIWPFLSILPKKIWKWQFHNSSTRDLKTIWWHVQKVQNDFGKFKSYGRKGSEANCMWQCHVINFEICFSFLKISRFQPTNAKSQKNRLFWWFFFNYQNSEFFRHFEIFTSSKFADIFGLESNREYFKIFWHF